MMGRAEEGNRADMLIGSLSLTSGKVLALARDVSFSGGPRIFIWKRKK